MGEDFGWTYIIPSSSVVREAIVFYERSHEPEGLIVVSESRCPNPAEFED